MTVYSLDGLVPVIDPSAFVHPQASIIGDVIIGARCYVGPVASLRGDFGRIIMHAGSNVQDCCVLHSFPDQDALLEQDSHIGHSAVLHGCTIRRGALIGIGAIVMDEVVVEEQAFVGAGSFVRAGFVVPRRTLVLGSPARVVRELTGQETRLEGPRHARVPGPGGALPQRLNECRPLTAASPTARAWRSRMPSRCSDPRAAEVGAERAQLRMRSQVTVPMPAKVMSSEPNRCAAAALRAHSGRPAISMPTISAEKVEKVVRPPQNPVMTNRRHSGAMAV